MLNMNQNEGHVEKNDLNNEIKWLSLIIVLGILIRLWRISAESFWLDEAYTAVLIQQSPSAIILGAANDVYPPLYYLVLSAISRVFGISEFVLRAPSAFFGILSIMAIWKLGKLLFNSPKIALLAAFLLAISPFSIRYSQEARTYSLLLFTILCSYLFFIRLTRKVTFVDMAGYSLSVLITIWSHSIGVIFIGLQVLGIATEGLVLRRLDVPWKAWFLSLAFAVISFLPWLSTLYAQYQEVSSGNFWVHAPSYWNFLSFLHLSSGSIWGLILAIPVFIGFIILWIKDTNARLLAYYGLFIPGAIWLLAVFVAPVFTTRNVLPALPALLLILAKTIISVKYKLIKLVVITIFCVGCFMTNYTYFTNPQKPPWREVAAYLEMHAQDNEKIMFAQQYGRYGVAAYFDLRALQQINQADPQAWLVIHDLEPQQREKLITGREIVVFKDVTLAYPLSSPQK